MNSPPLSPIPLLSDSPIAVGMKRRISDPDTTCASCEKTVSTPVPCTGCGTHFCSECIDSSALNCPRCETKKIKMLPVCKTHGKELSFFCLTCEKETCGDCILNVVDHKRHTFDRLDAVYLEKFTVTDEKLTTIKQQIDEVEKHSALSRKNLELINSTEENMLSELNLLIAASKNEIAEIIDDKRQELEQRINLPVANRQKLKQLEDSIISMSHFDFIQKQEQLNGECDKLREQFKDVSADLIDHYDIGCELIPTTKLNTLTVENDGSTMNVTIDDSTGDIWNVSIVKGDKLYLKVAPNETVPIITSYKFKVITEICHDDISKSLRKRFVIQRKMSQFELATKEQLSTEGYWENGALTLLLAIQPLNVVEECDHLKEKVTMLKNTLDRCRGELNEAISKYEIMKKDSDGLKGFAVGYFPLEYGSIQKQMKNSFTSPNIIDFNGNEWKMEVKFDRDEQNKIMLSVYIFPARIVTTSESSRRCTYFIELMHSNPDEIIRGYAEHLFEANGVGRGWKGFVDRVRVLNDVGFLRNGKVWFRYGVRSVA